MNQKRRPAGIERRTHTAYSLRAIYEDVRKLKKRFLWVTVLLTIPAAHALGIPTELFGSLLGMLAVYYPHPFLGLFIAYLSIYNVKG